LSYNPLLMTSEPRSPPAPDHKDPRATKERQDHRESKALKAILDPRATKERQDHRESKAMKAILVLMVLMRNHRCVWCG